MTNNKFLNDFLTLRCVTDTENFKPFYFGPTKQQRNKRNKKPAGGIMAKTTKIPMGYITSVTSVTKRNKRNKLNLDSKRNNVTSPPLRGDVCYACPGVVQKALALLKAEVLKYLDGYTSRGYHAEGRALARLRKAAQGNYPAPCPGSPGSPERAAEQRIRNERAARMADALARKMGLAR